MSRRSSRSFKKFLRKRLRNTKKHLKPVTGYLKKHPDVEFVVGAVLYNAPDPVPGPTPGVTDPVAIPMMVDGARRSKRIRKIVKDTKKFSKKMGKRFRQK